MEKLAKVSLFTRGCLTCVLPADCEPTRGEKCILEFEYGLDVGIFQGPCACASHPDGESPPPGSQRTRIVRRANEQDLVRIAENASIADQVMGEFVALVAETGPVIKPLMAHFTFNRDRLLLVFGSIDYIDCRRAVGVLQRQYNTRVEVRHVHIRDEASVVGGIGACGRPLCCATWLRVFKPVNLKMVKAQEISINPVAINGCCGRLKCCMRFEYEVYESFKQDLPEVGMRVCWQQSECVVVSRDVMQRKLLIRTPDQGVRHVSADELSHLEAPDAPARTPETQTAVTQEQKRGDPPQDRPESGVEREA